MRRWRVSVLMIWLIAVSGLPLQGVMAQATPSAEACRFSLDDPLVGLPDACLAISPWWEAYPDCPVTPIHPAPAPVREDLDFLPWFEVDMGNGVVATAFIWYGHRPLPVGSEYPDGYSTKVLWRFTERVQAFTITGTSQNDPTLVNVPAGLTSPEYQMGPEVRGAFQQWPSFVIAPAAGCWTFTLQAETLDDEPLTGQFVSVAAEP